MDSAVTKKCGGFADTLRTAVFFRRALSSFTKLVDGGEVKGKLFADAGVQLNGIKSCLKMLKWLSCYIFPGMSGLPREQCGTQEEQTTITTNSNVSLTSIFLQIWQNWQKHPIHPPQMCSGVSGFRCSLFHRTGSPAGSQIRNSAHSPANYMQIFNGYF